MKISIIGAVAGGTSAAAKARRNSESAIITMFDQDKDISYSACGLPYYLAGEIEEKKELTPRNTVFFQERYNIAVKTQHQVLEILPQSKKIKVKNLLNQEEFWHKYDKLVIATGATPKKLAVPGEELENIFSLRNVVSADTIKAYLQKNSPDRVTIIGSGFIGLEMLDAFLDKGIEITLIEKSSHLAPSFDKDLSVYLENYLATRGVNLILGEEIKEFQGDDRIERIILHSGREIAADLAVVAVGVTPNTELAQKAGIELGPTGAIKVNRYLQTTFPDIYAVGDCAETYSLITGKPFYRPLGTTANKMGRIAGENITGGSLEFRGVLGTGICKVGECTLAQTGLSEKEAQERGYQFKVVHNLKANQQTYYPGGSEMIIKGVADKESEKLLGVQIFGKKGVDKRIDVFATAISFRASVEDLFHLDLAYAPPYSTTKDPVAYTGMVLHNDLRKGRFLISPDELQEELSLGESIYLIDVRSPQQYLVSHLEGAVNIPLELLRSKIQQLDKEKNIVVYCNGGVSGNSAQNILLNYGFKRVRNLSGGHKHWQIWHNSL